MEFIKRSFINEDFFGAVFKVERGIMFKNSVQRKFRQGVKRAEGDGYTFGSDLYNNYTVSHKRKIGKLKWTVIFIGGLAAITSTFFHLINGPIRVYTEEQPLTKQQEKEQISYEFYDNSLSNNAPDIYPPAESVESYLAFQKEIESLSDNVITKLLNQLSKAGSEEFTVIIKDSNDSLDFIYHKAYNTAVPNECAEHRDALLELLEFEKSLLLYIQSNSQSGNLSRTQMGSMMSDIHRAREEAKGRLIIILKENNIKYDLPESEETEGTIL